MKENKILALRINLLKGKGSYRAFAEKCGISDGTARNLCKGKMGGISVLEKVASAHGVQVGWLTGETDEREAPKGNRVVFEVASSHQEDITIPAGTGLTNEKSRMASMVRIPVLGKVPAGIPKEVSEHISEYISVPGAPENCFALRVNGPSMEPTIRHDDYVLFVIDKEARHGDVVVVNDEFGDSMIKRLRKKNEEYFLASDNPDYPTVRPNGDYRIMGVVIDAWRKVNFRFCS